MVSVQEVATAVLAGATIILAWISWNLVRATRVLARIEERRERARARERKRSRIKKKLEITEMLVQHDWDDSIGPPLAAGLHLGPWAWQLRELETLVDFEKDQVLREDFGPLRLAFDAANQGTRYPAGPQRDLRERFNRIKERLGWDVQRWRNELVELSREETF